MTADSWMFRELTDPSPAIVSMLEAFDRMLKLGADLLGMATSVTLRGESSSSLREQVVASEDEIDHLERMIRRKLAIHATAYAANEMPTCLGLMSIVKDAERIGDYANGLFRLSERVRLPTTGLRIADLCTTSDQVLADLDYGRVAVMRRDADAARRVIESCTAVRNHCDTRVDELMLQTDPEPFAVTISIAYRRLHRIASHMRNIQTVLVQPLERLDFMP